MRIKRSPPLNIKIFLLGATGRTGKRVLAEGLARGFTIHALVRNPDKIDIKHPNLVIFSGSPAEKQLIDKAIAGCDVVISALNLLRKSDWPWARQLTPPGFIVGVIQHSLRAMKSINISRIIIVSAAGVGESSHEMPAFVRWLFRNSNIGKAYEEHAQQEALLKSSGMDYTIVRPVMLNQSEKTANVRVSINGSPKPAAGVSRKILAAFSA